MDYGFVRVGAAIPAMNVADCDYNAEGIIQMCYEANNKGVKVLAFPELSITGYSCGDLFGQSLLLDSAVESLLRICQRSKEWENLVIFVGAPLRCDGMLFNCAVCIHNGNIIGVVPKTFLPNYNEFYEKRWFASSLQLRSSTINIGGNIVPIGTEILFVSGDMKIGVEICEDLWTPIPPSANAAMSGANLIINMSASNEAIGKHNYLLGLIRQQSARNICAYIYSSAGWGESSTDLVFAGNAIIAENGTLLGESKRFSIDSQLVISDIDIERIDNDRRKINSFSDGDIKSYKEINLIINNTNIQGLMRTVCPLPFVPKEDSVLSERCEEILNIQSMGLMRRLSFTHSTKLIIGISGGLDSTLALLVAVIAFDRLGLDRKGIIGITMPGYGTTGRTYNNAVSLIKELGITFKEISIIKAVEQHFKDIGHDSSVLDVTYENSQARERTQILMDYANKVGGMVLGTGDLSELALGWATYNGDHMSMYGVNAGVPKTLVKYLVDWLVISSDETKNTIPMLYLNENCRNILHDVVATPISPELIPANKNGEIKQKTEDLVGPYELHDFFLYNMLRNGFSPSKIYFLAQKAFEDIYNKEIIKKWLIVFYRRFFSQQFKRSCLPDAPKVGSVTLSPRGDWRMPSDASVNIWLKDLEKI